MNLRIFVYFMEINFRIFNIIRIIALHKYQIVSNFYIKNKEKNMKNDNKTQSYSDSSSENV